ncbi:MAG: ATP-binding protein [Candidatus Woesearchaeota archaeon]
MNFQKKITIYFVIILVIFIILLGTLSYIFSYDIFIKQKISTLEKISNLKEEQLNIIIGQNIMIAKELSFNKDIIDYLKKFHSENTENRSPELELLEEEMEEKIKDYLNNKKSYYNIDSIYIVTLDKGSIDISTNPNLEKQIKHYERFFELAKNEQYVELTHFEKTLKTVNVLIAYPIKDNSTIGILVLLLDKDFLNKIMYTNNLGKTGESYIVLPNYLMVTTSRFSDENYKMVFSEPIVDCLKNNNQNSKIANDYRNKKVLSFYKWSSEYGACIITEQDFDEAMNEFYSYLITIILSVICVSFFAVFLSYILSKKITFSLNQIISQLKSFKEGIFSKGNVNSDIDEIIILQKAINETSEELKKLDELNKRFNEKLKEEVELKTSELKKTIEEMNNFKKALINIMEDLDEKNKHLKELDEAKTNFLNIASHELKTPLTAISAYIDILDDYKNEMNDEQKSCIETIKRNITQLKSIINNILEISRIESGRFEMIIKEINIKEKIPAIINNIKILAENKGLFIDIKIPDDIPNIFFDEMRFEEIIINLISNAVKFTEKGGITVNVEYNKTENFISIKISDTGIGIPEDKINKLFQNFYQVDSSISRKYGGTGLGLALTKKIVEYFNGTISVESKINEGTTFIVELPIDQKISKKR